MFKIVGRPGLLLGRSFLLSRARPSPSPIVPDQARDIFAPPGGRSAPVSCRGCIKYQKTTQKGDIAAALWAADRPSRNRPMKAAAVAPSPAPSPVAGWRRTGPTANKR